MSVAIRKVEGVASAKVSLNEGRADIVFKAGTRATVEQIREIVRRNGFTPKAANVKVVGHVVQQQGRSVLAVTNTDVVYLLADHADAEGKLAELQRLGRDQSAVVSGHVPETVSGAVGPLTLQVRDFTVEPR